MKFSRIILGITLLLAFAGNALAAISLSSFATQTKITINTADCGAGGVYALSLGSIEINPLTTTGFDLVPYDGTSHAQLTFTRVAFVANPFPTGTLFITLPAAATGANQSYTLIIASGYAAATDQSTALATPGPLLTGAAANTALSQWNMASSGTVTADSLSNNGTGTAAANPLVLVGSPVTTNSSIKLVPGTSVACPGVCITLVAASSECVYTTNPPQNQFMAATANTGFTLIFSASVASFANNPAVIWSLDLNPGTYLGITSAGVLKLFVSGGPTITCSGTYSINTTYEFAVTCSIQSTNVYVNGVLVGTGAGQITGGIYGAANVAVNHYFFCQDSTGTPAHFVGGSLGPITMASECYTAADVLAHYLCASPPVALVPKRKLVRIPAAGGYAEGQLLVPGLNGGWAENFLECSPLYFPNGAPGIAGSPYWIMAFSDPTQAYIGLAVCSSKDPTVRSAWSVISTPLVGPSNALSHQAGAAVQPDLVYDASQGKYLLSWTTGDYGLTIANNAIVGVLSSDLNSNWGPLLTLINATQAGAQGISTLSVFRIMPISTGGYKLGAECFISNYVNTEWTSPNLVSGGTWTFNAGMTNALANSTLGVSSNGFLGAPGECQYGARSYDLWEFAQTNYIIVGGTTDTTNFTSYTQLADPVLEQQEPWEIFDWSALDTGVSTPNPMTDGTNTYVFNTGGTDLGVGSVSSIELSKYPGTPDRLWGTGTIGPNYVGAPPRSGRPGIIINNN